MAAVPTTIKHETDRRLINWQLTQTKKKILHCAWKSKGKKVMALNYTTIACDKLP